MVYPSLPIMMLMTAPSDHSYQGMRSCLFRKCDRGSRIFLEHSGLLTAERRSLFAGVA